MLAPLGHTVLKEFLVLLRDPASRGMVIGAPLLQLLIFSFAATLEIRNVNVAIVNQDMGPAAHEFVQRVEVASFVDELIFLPSIDKVESLINTRDVLLAIHFQPDFSRSLASGEPPGVQVLVDGRRANAGQIAFSYLLDIASQLQIDLSASQKSMTAPEANVRYWYNPNLEFRWFIVPALVTTLAFIPAISISILGVVRDRELGTLDQLVVSPVSTLEIILGKALPPIFSGLLSSVMVFLLAVFAYQVPFTGSLFILFTAIAIFVFSATGFGLMISAGVTTQQQATIGMFTLTVPMFITSGFFSPVENMPVFLQVFSELNPLKHAMIVVQGSFLQGITLVEAWPNIWPMMLLGTVTMSVAAVLLRLRIQ
jgi:drug efflux transport system permease protein